jgi:hypothetical protein
MALNLNSLAGKTASAEVHFMGQTAKVVYDPTYITQNTLTEATTKSDEAFMVMFCKLVKSWDVTLGSKKVPLTTKALADVPLVFLRACFQTIMGEAGSGSADEEGKGSSGS